MRPAGGELISLAEEGHRWGRPLSVWRRVFCCILWVVFLCRYGNVPFTKNPEKYIKYQVDQVGEMIEKLFDTSA